MPNYFDLTNSEYDLSTLTIEKVNVFECRLIDNKGIIYNGFILAKSESNRILTISEFQISSTDNKFQARLIFKKTDVNFAERNVNKGVDFVRIPFEKGQEGYREFWKMISFLYKWREIIDLEEFEDYFSVTDKNISEFVHKIGDIENKETVLNALGAMSTIELSNLTDLVSVTKIKNILQIWNENKENYTEEFWQTLFQENSWILSQIFACPFVQIGKKFYCGGKEDDDRGGVKGDFLYQNNLTSNLAFIEIKTPENDLIIGSQYRGAEDGKENVIYSMGKEITGGINQLLNQRKIYLKTFAEHNGNQMDNPRCILIIGITPDDEDQRRSFELYRHSLNSIEIVTFDELFKRIELILEIF